VGETKAIWSLVIGASLELGVWDLELPRLLMLDAQFTLIHPYDVVQPNRVMTKLTPLGFIALLVLSCNFCFAQPSGQFSLDFANSTPLIDMNGVFSVTDQIVGAADQPINLSYSVHLTHAGNGALRGVPGDAALVQIGDADFVAAFYRASGRVSGGGASPITVFLTVNLRGEGQVAGVETVFNITVSYKLTFNPESGQLEGASRGNAKFSLLGGGKISSTQISAGLPSGGDGSWSVAMNVIPFKTLSGSAQISLSGGRTVNGTLLGRFFQDSEISVLRFSGTNVDRGAAGTFSFSIVQGVDELETVQGKILGQRVIF